MQFRLFFGENSFEFFQKGFSVQGNFLQNILTCGILF